MNRVPNQCSLVPGDETEHRPTPRIRRRYRDECDRQNDRNQNNTKRKNDGKTNPIAASFLNRFR